MSVCGLTGAPVSPAVFVRVRLNDATTVFSQFTADGLERGELDYDKQGDFYPDLLAVLRDRSPRFNELIDKQVSKPFTSSIVNHGCSRSVEREKTLRAAC